VRVGAMECVNGKFAGNLPQISSVQVQPSERVIETRSTCLEAGFEKPCCTGNLDLHKHSVAASTALSSSRVSSTSLLLASNPRVREEQENYSEEVRHLLSLVEGENCLAHMSTFAKAYCSRDFCGRLLHKYRGDVQKSAAMLERALTWRQQHERLLTLREFKEASDLRIIGSDSAGRPILYQCARNQLLPNSQGLDQYVVCMLQAIDAMPAAVSTMTHIWDMHGLRIMLNLNPAAVLALLRVLEAYFAERMHQLLVVDAPRAAQFLVDAVWPMVPESTRQKVAFLSADAVLLRLEAGCGADVFGHIQMVVRENRDSRVGLEQRRRTWSQQVPVKSDSCTRLRL